MSNRVIAVIPLRIDHPCGCSKVGGVWRVCPRHWHVSANKGFVVVKGPAVDDDGKPTQSVN